MPSIHISEAVMAELIEKEGGYQEAKEAVKQASRDLVDSGDEDE